MNINIKKLSFICLTLSQMSFSAERSKEELAPDVLKNIQEAASEGKPQAQFELGCLLSSGEHIKKDPQRAYLLFLEAAKKGYFKAQYKVGMAYFNGLGVSKDQKEGLAWVYLAIKGGVTVSVLHSMEAAVGEQGKKTAEQRCQALIQSLPLGFVLGLGEMPPDDFEMKTMHVFADAGESDSLFALEKWAQRGSASAQFYLGALYENGRAVPKDHVKAVKLYLEAAEQGYPEAQYQLGAMYADGQGVSKSEGLAVMWLRKAAEQGHPEAQYRLGMIYHFGQSVTKNKVKEVEWFRKAAEQGHAKAQKILGIIYYSGIDVTKNYLEAYRWLLLASAQGQDVYKYISNIESYLTPIEIEEGKRLSRESIVSKNELNY